MNSRGTPDFHKRPNYGKTAIAMHVNDLWWAVDALMSKFTVADLNRLKVRSGEHLAAIITTMFLRRPPTSLDLSGGPDLIFDGHPTSDDLEFWIGQDAQGLAFEVKSAPGNFREEEAAMNRIIDRGGSAEGRGVTVRGQSCDDILRGCRPKLDDAAAQLLRKIGPGTLSRNAFLVVHPFDQLGVEAWGNTILAPWLRPLRSLDLDSVWVLWFPSHLTLWSRERREWINLLFESLDPEQDYPHLDGDLDALQLVELEFLRRIGHTDPSPYTFSVTSSLDSDR